MIPAEKRVLGFSTSRHDHLAWLLQSTWPSQCACRYIDMDLYIGSSSADLAAPPTPRHMIERLTLGDVVYLHDPMNLA